MSVSVISTPPTFGWAKNRNSLRLQCDALATTGSTATIYVRRSGVLPEAGCHVVLCIDGRELVYTVVNTAGGAYEVAESEKLFDAIRANWYVQQLFRYPVSTNTQNTDSYLTLVGRTQGYHKVEIYCTAADGTRTYHEESMLSWVLGKNGAGVDRAEKPNYAIAAEIEAVVNDYNVLTTHKVGGLVFHPDTKGVATIPLDALAGLVPQPDLPTTDTTTADWQLLTNMLLKYRISYGEAWGESTPLVQNWTTTGYRYALCGEVADRFARLNLPDWYGVAEHQIGTDDNNFFWVLGEDDGQTVRVRRDEAEYVYGLWFDSKKGTYAELTVQMTVTINGKVTTTTHSVRNGEVYRIPVGPAALGAARALYYTVKLASESMTWERTYTVEAPLWKPTRFLLQTKYGYVRPLAVPEVRREVLIEGEVLKADRHRYLDITELGEEYTARTALLTREEARRLAQCIGQEYHYVQCGTSWLRITIEAGTFAVLDEAEDMLRVEFKYRFVENQGENITHGTAERRVVGYKVDFDEGIVAFGERIEPAHNSLINL